MAVREVCGDGSSEFGFCGIAAELTEIVRKVLVLIGLHRMDGRGFYTGQARRLFTLTIAGPNLGVSRRELIGCKGVHCFCFFPWRDTFLFDNK